MDEVTGGLTSAWRGAVRGMKTGYKMTKTALTNNHALEKLRAIGGAGGGMSHGDIRRMFQLRYGAEVRTDEGGRVAAVEATDVESSDEEALTDEQVHERVDKKFFDKSYDPVRYELNRMEVAYDESEEHSSAERAAAEQKILEYRQKCDVVSTTLKKRVLAHHQEFVSGIEDIKGVNDSLFQASSDCKKTRAAIRKSRASVTSQISLIAQSRVRENIRSTLSVLGAMERMVWKRNQLLALISSGKFVDAQRLLKEAGTIDREEELMRVYSMKAVINEWRLYRDNPGKLRQSLEAVVTGCLTVKFIPATYRNAMESSTVIGDAPQTCAFAAQQLWSTAVQILTKSLVEVSYVKNDAASIADIAEGIHPDHLMLCVCQMAARLVDFFYIYATIVRLHTEEAQTRGSYTTFAGLHAQALQQVQGVGSRIGRDLVEKLTLTLSSAQLDSVGIDRALHLFVVVSMLVEALVVLGLSKAELASARTQVKGVLLSYIARQFQAPKAREVLSFMAEDSWVVSDLSAPSLNIVKPLAPAGYKARIKEVKRYLALPESGAAGTEAAADDGAGPSGAVHMSENPFYSTSMLIPQDTSSLVQTETFGQYWAALRDPERAGGGGVVDAEDGNNSASAIGFALPGALAVPGRTDTAGRAASLSSTTAGPAVSTLAAAAVMPPTVLTSSAIAVANIFMEYVARIAVRFPPLAADILNWCDDLIGLYMYTTADNFVSVSRNVPVEQQADFSVQTQRMLAQMRAAGERALGATHGMYRLGSGTQRPVPASPAAGGATSNEARFPPRVWGGIRGEFGSEAHQYALASRSLACEACTTLIFLHEAVVRSFGPLLPPAVVQQHLGRVKAMYTAAIEVLHVCMHRLCQAIYPMEAAINDIGKLKPSKDEVKVSAYVRDVIAGMQALNSRRCPMPTPALETLFLQRFIFAVQATLVREYAKLTKKKLNDIFVMQLQVDTQHFQQQAAAAFGRQNVVLPDYVLGLVKTGFYMDDREQRLAWVRRYHASYQAVDLVNWFSAGDKVLKLQLEDLLMKELQHQDCIPIDKFIQEV